MKPVKLYNVIFPIWLILFFPPVIFITLAGNFIIDSLVILACFFAFKLSETYGLKTFYRKSVLKVWIFGFLADIIGASLLFLCGISGDTLGLPYEVTSGINFDPFSNSFSTAIIISSMILAAVLIFIFSYWIVFANMLEDKKLKLKVAITVSIVTMPWTFLLPTKWFYKGF